MLDIETPGILISYLRETGHIAADEQPGIDVLAGGVSNRTVLMQRTSGEAWVVKQALAKLRVTVDWYSSPERIHREALGLQYVGALLPPGTVPAVVFEDTANHILAMQAVHIPHTNWKQMLLAGDVEPDHVRQFAHLLGTLHSQSSMRQAELQPIFADRSYFETLRLEPYYRYTGQQIPSTGCFYDALIAETYASQLALVHGDYSPKNILVYRGQLVLLDYEVIHFGDPAFDIGFSLTHLLNKAHHHGRMHRQRFVDAAHNYWHHYTVNIAGLAWATPDYQARAARHTLACLLARVAGRSPLEYLDRAEKERQQAAVIALMPAPPTRIPELIDRFMAAL